MKHLKVLAHGVLVSSFALNGLNVQAFAKGESLIPYKDKTYELGDEVKLESLYFLSQEQTPEPVKEGTKLSSDLMTDKEHYEYDEIDHTVVTKGKEFLDVGKYDVTLTYNSDEITVDFEVKDTVAPVFKDLKQEIKIEKNAAMSIDDFKRFFEVFDLSEFELFIDTSNVDFNRVGTYPMQVIARDKYGNETTKIVSVVVVSTEEAEETGDLTSFVDGVVPVSIETRERMEAGETNIHETVVETEEQETQEQTQQEQVNDDPVVVPINPPQPEPQPEPEPEPDPEPVITTETIFNIMRSEEMENKLLSSINAARIEAGYTPVITNEDAQASAVANAELSAKTNAPQFDHATLPADTSEHTYSGQTYSSQTEDEVTNRVVENVASQQNVEAVGVAVYESTKTTNTLIDGVVSSSTTETSYYASVVTETPAVQPSDPEPLPETGN